MICSVFVCNLFFSIVICSVFVCVICFFYCYMFCFCLFLSCFCLFFLCYPSFFISFLSNFYFYVVVMLLSGPKSGSMYVSKAYIVAEGRPICYLIDPNSNHNPKPSGGTLTLNSGPFLHAWSCDKTGG